MGSLCLIFNRHASSVDRPTHPQDSVSSFEKLTDRDAKCIGQFDEGGQAEVLFTPFDCPRK